MTSNFSIDGLATGLNTTQIISQLMSIERGPERIMQAKVSAFDAQAAAWKAIAAKLGALGTATADLVTPTRLNLLSATSSSASVTATASTSASPGSLTFRVAALATAHQVVSAGVASSASVVGAGTATLGQGLPALGLRGAVADVDLADGAHTLTVTRSSAAASVAATAWAGPVTLSDGANQLAVVVDGQARTLTVEPGTYETPEALAAAVARAAGPDATAGVVDGGLVLRTAAEGSAATLQVTGGSGLAALGLSAGAPVTGTDGVLDLDGVERTVSSVTAAATLTLASAAGTLAVTLGGGLRAGTGTVTVLRSAAGATLSSLAADLRAADPSVTTSLVDTGDGGSSTRLVVAAKDTGLAAAFTLDLSGYAGIGATSTMVQGRDAEVRLGSLTVHRATNTVTDVLPGVTLQLAGASPATDVTVTVGRDGDAVVAKVKALVDAVNEVLAKAAEVTKYDPAAKKASALTGDSRARSMVGALLGALQRAGAGSLKSLSQVGVTFQRAGTFALDEDKLRAALSSDFDGVTALLARSGGTVPADDRVRYAGAGTSTAARTTPPYAVVVTRAATAATVTGSAFTTLGAADDIVVTVGAKTLTYQAQAGATPDVVAAELNDRFAAQGVRAAADVVDGAVRISTLAYGSAATLSVTAGGSGLTGSATGTDVAGTIDGEAAKGTGQTLTTTTGAAEGLTLTVAATPADVAGAGGGLALGVRYDPGVVGALSSVVARLTAAKGLVTTAQAGAEATSKDFISRIDAFELRMAAVEERYRTQFARLETVMSQLKSQSSWLTSQLAALPTPGKSS